MIIDSRNKIRIDLESSGKRVYTSCSGLLARVRSKPLIILPVCAGLKLEIRVTSDGLKILIGEAEVVVEILEAVTFSSHQNSREKQSVSCAALSRERL